LPCNKIFLAALVFGEKENSLKGSQEIRRVFTGE
jgi:hypothetical protein